MSMKRTKKSSSARSSQAEGSLGFNPPTSALPDWTAITTGQPDEAFAPYALAKTFAKDALVLHSKFGKGVVVGVDGPRVEVLFAEGVKKLAHAGG